MAKLNNREAMVPWGVAFCGKAGNLPHFAQSTHETRIWATTRRLAQAAAKAMVAGDLCVLWGVAGFVSTVAAEPDGDLNIWPSDLLTSSKRGEHEFFYVPIVDFGCLDDDDLATIGARSRAKGSR
jgi:hypothetical protein